MSVSNFCVQAGPVVFVAGCVYLCVSYYIISQGVQQKYIHKILKETSFFLSLCFCFDFSVRLRSDFSFI